MQTELDGEEDHFEELWGEQVAETEDDVMSLAVSFLLVQAPLDLHYYMLYTTIIAIIIVIVVIKHGYRYY